MPVCSPFLCFSCVSGDPQSGQKAVGAAWVPTGQLGQAQEGVPGVGGREGE